MAEQSHTCWTPHVVSDICVSAAAAASTPDKKRGKKKGDEGGKMYPQVEEKRKKEEITFTPFTHSLSPAASYRSDN